MEFRGIRQTSHIGGENRNPDYREHDKALIYDDNLKKIKYVAIPGAQEPNTKTQSGYVYRGDSSSGAEYIWKLDANKNPFWRKEEYLKTVTRESGGNAGLFTMNNGGVKLLPLGALAWLDTIDATLILPGNSKVLFDDNDSIGGDSSFTFDKTNKTINLTAFTGFNFKNNSDSSQQSVLQYFGGNNLLLAHGVSRSVSWGDNLVNNINIGESAGGGFTTAQNNVILGHYSGSNTSNNITGSVFIGNYSGRLETANNKFYLGNSNYATLGEFRDGSLLYGDFSTGWLKVNNRLEVAEELKIGSFDVLNTPSWGMLQFIETAAPGVYKPQFHDGSVWQDFANGANYYLQNVTKGTADVGTTSSDYRLTFDMNGVSDITLQLGSNAFNSDVIPTASPDLLAGYIQLSSGDNSDSNRGFTHSADLSFIDNRLAITGDLTLSTTSLVGGSAGLVKFDGNHFYGYAKDDDNVDFEWRRLDVDPLSVGENNTASNIGISGIGLFYQKEAIDLEFKTIESVDDRVVLFDNGTNYSVDFALSLTPSAQNITPVTLKTYSGSVLGSIADANTTNPKLYFKKLISNTVQITENANEVILEVTGAGGGESNTITNLGSGVGVYKEKVSADFKLKTITNGSHNTIIADPNGLELYVEVDDITLTNSGAGEAALSLDTDSFDILQKTFIDGVATEVVSTANDLSINVTKEIPRFEFITTPQFISGLNPGQGVVVFNTDYSADIRTSSVLTETAMFALNIGVGLYYDTDTNTLESTSSSGSNTDYRLSSIDKTGATFTLNVTDEYGTGTPSSFDISLGDLSLLDTLNSQYSIEGNGLISSPFMLKNDASVVDPYSYYGTNSSGERGWYPYSMLGGSVVSVMAGDGMDFSTIDSAGEVILGTPSSISWDSINTVTTNSHTHEIEDSGATAGTYTNATITINAKGFVESASNGSPTDYTSGDGMDFTGTEITLGTPSTIDSTTTNSVSTTSHTHDLGSISTANLPIGTTSGTVLEGRTFGTAANSDTDDFVQIDPVATQTGYADLTSYKLNGTDLYSSLTTDTVEVWDGTKHTSITNAAGFLKNDGVGNFTFEASSQVNSDWDATSGVEEILNVPTLVRQVGALTGTGSVIKTVSGIELDSSIGWNNGVQILTGLNPTFNPANGLNVKITMEGTVTMTFQSLIAGQSGFIHVQNIVPEYYINLVGSYAFSISRALVTSGDNVRMSGSNNLDEITWNYDGTRVVINGQYDIE